MGNYTIKNHRKGLEADHARIGIQIALNWLWPLAHDQEDWETMNAMPGFDPDTRLYCYLGDEMVGCMFWQDNPLPRASFGTGHYESITGADSLALSLLQLHAATHELKVAVPCNGIDR